MRKVAREREPFSLSLLPVSAMLRREVLASLRRPRTIFFVGGTTGLMLILFLVRLPGDMYSLRSSPDSVLSPIIFALLLLTLVLIPPLIVYTVREEKQKETLDLLAMSLVRPEFILLGKLISVGAPYVLTLIAILPVFGVCFFFVGLEVKLFALLCTGLLYAAIQTACTAAFCAVSVHSPVKAVLLTYPLLLVFFSVGCPVLGVTSQVEGFGAQLFFSIVSVGFILLFSALPFSAAVESFIRVTEPPVGKNERLIHDPARLRKRRRQFPFYLDDPCSSRRPIGDRQNAMYCRELITSPFGRTSLQVWKGLIYAVCFVGMIAVTSFAGTAQHVYQMMLVHAGILCLVVPVFTATLMAKEHELDNLDMLRMTLLTPREILRGKVLAGLRFVLPLFLAPAAALMMMWWAGANSSSLLAASLPPWVALANFTLFLVTLTLASTIACKRTAMCLFTGFFIPFVVVIGVPFLLLFYLPTLISDRPPVFVLCLLSFWPSPHATAYVMDDFTMRNTWLAPWPESSILLLLNQTAIAVWTFILFTFCSRHYTRHLMRDA